MFPHTDTKEASLAFTQKAKKKKKNGRGGGGRQTWEKRSYGTKKKIALHTCGCQQLFTVDVNVVLTQPILVLTQTNLRATRH